MVALFSRAQLMCLSGLLLLAVAAPTIPRRAGISPLRPVELLVFWSSIGLLLASVGRVRSGVEAIEDAGQLQEGDRLRVTRAALGVFLAALVTLLMLTNLLCTSLWGMGILRTLRTMVLYRESVGWSLLLPLGVTLGLQLPLWRAASQLDSTLDKALDGHAPRGSLPAAYFVLVIGFGMAWFLSLTDRWFLLVAVVFAWCGGVQLLLSALAHLAWSHTLRVAEQLPRESCSSTPLAGPK